MSYSQSNEEELILNYFQQAKGTFLDIGSNDGITYSNTRALALLGWKGVCVDASETCFIKLQDLYEPNMNVYSFNVAVGTENKKVTFYESGSHLGQGDTSLLSTINPDEMKRWPNETFEPKQVLCIPFAYLLEGSPYKTFDMISIDAEGLDYDILTQMDLNKLKCKLLIVETNSIEDEKYINYCKQFDMRVLYKNAENLIFVK